MDNPARRGLDGTQIGLLAAKGKRAAGATMTAMRATSPKEPPIEVYPGAPLRAVAIEVYFGALLDAYARFGTFQRAHQEFTRVILPTDWEDRSELDRGAILVDSTKEKAVAVSPDQVAIVTYKYGQGYVGFTEWALPLLREALDVLGVRELTRVRYRYENVITIPSRDAVELETLFMLRLPRPPLAERSVSNLHLYWKQRWPDGGCVDIALDSCSEMADDGTAQLYITAQCCGPMPVPLTQVEQKVAEAHRMARLTFEELITDGHRERLRAEARLQ